MSSISRRRKDQKTSRSHLTGEQKAQKTALLPTTISPKMRGTKLVLAASSFVNLHRRQHSSQADPRRGKHLQRLRSPIGRVASSRYGDYAVGHQAYEHSSICEGSEADVVGKISIRDHST